MKKFLLFLTVTVGLLFAACSSKPSTELHPFKDVDTTAPRVLVYDSTPVYVKGVAHNEWKPVSTRFDSAQFSGIHPTWGQSFAYAFKTGYTPILIIGIILLIAGIGGYTLFEFDALDKVGIKFKKEPNSFVVSLVLFAIIAAGAVTVYSKPGHIRWNNDKKVKVTYFEQKGAPAVWDSLYDHNLIIGASHK